MSLVGFEESYVPLHARPTHVAETPSKKRSWTPLLVIVLVYLVLFGLNEMRIRSHIQRAPAVETPVVFVETGVEASNPG